MKKRKGILLLLLFLVMFLFLQGFNAYHFYYIEQFQLFLKTWLYFIEKISYPGGTVEYFSQFLVQFFIVPYLGAVIVAFIHLIIFIESYRLILRNEKTKLFFFAPATILLSCLLMCFNINIYFHYVLSFLLCIICLNLYTSIKNSIFRTVAVFATVPLLYWIAGSVSILFAVCFFLYELINVKDKKNISWLLLPIWACLISWCAVRFSLTGNFRTSLLPDMYCLSNLHPPASVYIPWLLLPVWIIVVSFLPKSNFSERMNYWVLGVQTILFLFLSWQGFLKFGDRNSYEIKKLDYFARLEQWEKIIEESSRRNINNYLCHNYLNLALAEKSSLLQKMFQFNQRGPLSLEVPRKQNDFISALISDISFSVGDIASSQRYAFEGYETCSGGGSGRLLKRLIQTNLIFGEYAVAEKYIRILEHTFFYREWATNQRQFLYNESLCIQDPLISKKRGFLPTKGKTGIVGTFPETLKALMDINPSNSTARDYFFAYLLLSKEIYLFLNLFSDYQQVKIFPAQLPYSINQALLIGYETQPEKWKETGISKGTVDQFSAYKSLFIKTRRLPSHKEIMQKQFGSTYWFYFHFINI